MGQYDFDTIYDRRNTSSLKYDFGMERMGRDDLLPLWVADMDFRLPRQILEPIAERVEHGIFGYTDPKEDYDRALRGWYSRRQGFQIGEKWNTVAPGVVYAIAATVRAFTEPGQAVIIQQPVYYPFMETIELNKRKLVNNQLLYKNGHYEIDFEDFENKIISEDVKLFILCSPHNPVGRVWKKEELLRLMNICRAHDVMIFSDEIHSDFVFQGYEHTSLLALDQQYFDRLIVATSPSKSFNIAGLQVANILIPDEKIREKYRNENTAAGYSQGNTLGMVATIAAYTKGEVWFEELLSYLQENISYIRDFLAEKLPEVKLTKAEGTYLAWLDFSELYDDPNTLEHIVRDKARLWLDSGAIFGKETALFERVNVACPRMILEQAMNQLYSAITEDSK